MVSGHIKENKENLIAKCEFRNERGRNSCQFTHVCPLDGDWLFSSVKDEAPLACGDAARRNAEDQQGRRFTNRLDFVDKKREYHALSPPLVPLRA